MELIRLFHEVHSDDITGHVYRGYTLLKKSNTEEVIRHIEVIKLLRVICSYRM